MSYYCIVNNFIVTDKKRYESGYGWINIGKRLRIRCLKQYK